MKKLFYVYGIAFDALTGKVEERNAIGFEFSQKAFDKGFDKGVLVSNDGEVALFKEFTPVNVVPGIVYFTGVSQKGVRPTPEAHDAALEKIRQACIEYVTTALAA